MVSKCRDFVLFDSILISIWGVRRSLEPPD